MQLSRTRVELVRESRFATGGAISFSLVRILRRQWQFRQLATADDFLESLPCVNCRGQHPPELAPLHPRQYRVQFFNRMGQSGRLSGLHTRSGT